MAWIKKFGTIEFCIWIVALLLVLSACFTRQGVSDGIPAVVSIWVIGTGSVLVFMTLKNSVRDGQQCAVLYAAYIVRVACMLVDIYGREYITLLHSGADTEGFYKGGQRIYYGIQSGGFGTKYPYILNIFFQMTGDNRVCAQYINIIFWVLSVFVLVRLCHHFKVKKTSKTWIFILWGFLSTGILLTSILLRESMEMFFGLWSFERFIYWMESGKKRYCVEAFLFVLPAAVLHSASVALWAAYAVVAMFWNPVRKKYRWQIKSMVVFMFTVAGIILIFCTPLRLWLFAYFGGDFSLYGITHRPFEAGGSDYLVGMDCQSWIQFVPYTLIRMFYFLFSPLPTEARGLGDLLMFLADGFLLLVVIYFLCRNMCRKKEIRGYTMAALLGVIMFAGIFAWGCRNAGTALRHRYLAWSIAMAGLCICCGEKTEGESV